MKKTLLFFFAFAMSAVSYAQVESVQSSLKNIPETQVKITETELFDAVDLAEQETAPVIAIKRPAGLFYPGYQQKSTAVLTVPYAKAPAYAPLKWEILKEDWSGNEATGTFSLAVPCAKTAVDESPEWIVTDGAAIETSLIAMGSKFYPSPYATCANDKGETSYTMLPPYVKSDGSVTNPAQVYAGGSLPSSSTSGYQMAANYNAYWGSSWSYSSKYYGFNTKSSNDGWSSKYPEAQVLGICELFDKPASPYILRAANWYFYLPSGGSAGTLKMTISPVSESGVIGEPIAVAYGEEPAALSTTRMLYQFTGFEDADGKAIETLIIDSSIMIEVAPMEDDTETNLIAYYIPSPNYLEEAHAYVHLAYNKDGNPAQTWASGQFKWTKSDGTASYQSSFTCGLDVVYPFAKILDENYVPTTENIMNVPVEGGSQEFFFDAYYNHGAWKIYSEDGAINFKFNAGEWTSEEAGWLKINTTPGKTETGGFNGEVTMNITADANAGDEETVNLIVDCYGFKEPITIKRAGNATGIANVGLVKAANNVTYNLQGQRVNAQAKGIVVRNGAKFVNK